MTQTPANKQGLIENQNACNLDFTSDGSILVFDKLCKNYQLGAVELRVLREIDLVVKKGDYLAIMGPSGSGKSTMLNIIGCLDRPSAGKYILGGQDVSTLDDDQLSSIRGRHVGFVFQSFNLIAQLNVLENIEIPMFYQGLPQHQSSEKAKELADLVGLGDRILHRPSELSGGQQQRVAIARALANDPLIVLADEPTGNLDSQSGKDILNILDKLHDQGKTLIVITHDENIAQHCRREIRLLDGQIQKQVVRN
jgi:putative ABC transport system ATP-binding protein